MERFLLKMFYIHQAGIMNTALNCYINAVIQCLFNLSQFQDIVRELHRVHPGKCDHTCQQKSKHTRTHAHTHTHKKKKNTQKRGIKILVSLWYINRQSAQSPVCSIASLHSFESKGQNLRKEKQVLHKIMHPSNKVTIFPSDVGGASWWEELVCGWG